MCTRWNLKIEKWIKEGEEIVVVRGRWIVTIIDRERGDYYIEGGKREVKRRVQPSPIGVL